MVMRGILVLLCLVLAHYNLSWAAVHAAGGTSYLLLSLPLILPLNPLVYFSLPLNRY